MGDHSNTIAERRRISPLLDLHLLSVCDFTIAVDFTIVIFAFCFKDRRGEKRSLEWWAGAVSASQDVMECVQEQRGSNGVDLCCGTAFSGKLHVFQEVCLIIPTPSCLWCCTYMPRY